MERSMPVTKELRRDTFLKEVQLGFWKRNQSRATSKTDRQFWEYQDARFIKALQAGEVDVDLCAKLCLLSAPARYACHN